MGREFELKYQATPEIIGSIREKFGGFTPISMETTYYDTEDFSLRKRKWTLRQRLENGRAVCTVKTPLPDGSRGEWETVSASLMAGVLALVSQGAPEELLDLTAGGVTPFCGAQFTRLAREISLPQGSVELAPILGLADAIVDIVETGATLKANGLVPIETVAPISARLIVNTASMKLYKNEILDFISKCEQYIEG